MTRILDYLEHLGGLSLSLWLPILAWTVLAALSTVAFSRWRGAPPGVHYALRQALLLALPLGLGLAWVLDVSFASFWQPAYTPQYIAAPTEAVTFTQPVAPAAPVEPPGRTLDVLLGLLLVGALLLALVRLVRLAAHGIALNRFKKDLDFTPVPHLQGEVDACTAHLGLRRRIRGVVSDRVAVPLTFGCLRPTIVLPSELMPDARARRLALLHEMIHIRRNDYLMHGFEQLIGAAFYLHPLVGFLRNSIGSFREMLCDAEVLAQPGASPRHYAALLYRFTGKDPLLHPLALRVVSSNNQLKKRIEAMTTNAYHPFFNPKGIAVMLFIFMLGGLAGAVAFSDLFGSRTVELEEIVIMPAQEEETPATSDEAFVIVEQMPELIGGLSALQEELRYPAIARKAGIEGRVFVQFIIDEEGRVVDPEVVRGIGAGCDEEAVRAVQQMRFVPGRQRGEAVRVKMSLPVTFRLNNAVEARVDSAASAVIDASARFQPRNGRTTFDLETEGGFKSGSVRLTANGELLREGSDYTVDYEAGTVTITEPTSLQSHKLVKISYNWGTDEEAEATGETIRQRTAVFVSRGTLEEAKSGGVLIRERPVSQN